MGITSVLRGGQCPKAGGHCDLGLIDNLPLVGVVHSRKLPRHVCSSAGVPRGQRFRRAGRTRGGGAPRAGVEPAVQWCAAVRGRWRVAADRQGHRTTKDTADDAPPHGRLTGFTGRLANGGVPGGSRPAPSWLKIRKAGPSWAPSAYPPPAAASPASTVSTTFAAAYRR